MILRRWLVVLSLVLLSQGARAQSASDGSYSRVNTFAAFTEYSNDSSHILLGQARNRKIGAVGFEYNRRLFHRRLFDFAYQGEVRPGIVESDPMATYTNTITLPATAAGTYPSAPQTVDKCVAVTAPYRITEPDGTVYAGVGQETCSRRQVFAQGMSPIGFRVTLLPRHRLQPTFSSVLGYMFSTQQVPVSSAGSFNFTFGAAVGLELYWSHSRSIRLEYAVQHYSNKWTAPDNPGVDSGFIRLTYAMGH